MTARRIKLHGFNNLIKSLSLSFYEFCYAETPKDRIDYIAGLDERYDADHLTRLLTETAETIGATVLHVSGQDYEPQGASVTMMVAEGPLLEPGEVLPGEVLHETGYEGEHVVAHLDKSHIATHTYPEIHPTNGICSFRVDIDVATCGLISPLKALGNLVRFFNPDVATADYRVRGFTRDIRGRKHFIDHRIHSIQEYLPRASRSAYEMVDINVYRHHLYHTRMQRRAFELDNYLHGLKPEALDRREQARIRRTLQKEMLEVFNGQPL